MKPQLILLIVTFILFATGFIVVLSLKDIASKKFPEYEYSYGIMIDAGSSHSTIHIYKWKTRTDKDPPEVTPLMGQLLTVNPGINSFLGNETGLHDSMKTLIDFAKSGDRIPEKQWKETPLYLRATAGMRLLNQTSQEWILSRIRTYFMTTGFSFSNDQASVIPGEYEGAYGWITVNHLLGNLGQSGATVGALDLGGASTQITFEPTHSWNKDVENDHFPLDIGDKHYDLYVHSYLGWGGDQARNLYRSSLPITPTGPGGTDEIIDPCLPIGYNTTYNSYPVVGSSNYTECRQLQFSQVMFNTSVCTTPPCTFDNVYMPSLDGNFQAFSLFYYTASFFNMSASDSKPQDFFTQSQTYCGLNWNEIQQTYGSSSFLKDECFNAIYCGSLLAHYGFDMSQVGRIRIDAKIQGEDIGWAYGAMIYEANYLPIVTPQDKVGKYPNGYVAGESYGVVLIILFVVGMVISGVSIFFMLQSPRTSSSSYKLVEDGQEPNDVEVPASPLREN